MLKAFSLQIFVTLITLNIAIASAGDEIQVPKTFLSTDYAPAQRLLSIKITADFKDVTTREAIEYILQKSKGIDVGAKFEVDWAALKALEELTPRFTRKLKNAPLRTWFYVVSRDTGTKCKWVYKKKRPYVLVFEKP